MLKKIYGLFHHHYHTRYHGIYRHAKKLFVFDLFLLGLAVLMLGSSIFFFFWKPGITDLIDMRISLGDARIKSGENVCALIYYANRSKIKLQDVTLAVRMPPGFIIDRAKSADYLSRKNDYLDPGLDSQTEICGTLWTEPKKEERIVATLTYRPENKTETEQKISSMIVALPESVLTLQVKMNSNAFPGTSLPYEIIVKNTSNQDLQDVNITHNWPEKLADENKMSLFSLKAQEEKTFAETLTMPNKALEIPLNFSAEIVINGKKIVQSSSANNISVIAPKLTSAVNILDNLSYAEGGSVIPLAVNWKNESDYSFKNLKLRFSFSPSVVDLTGTAKENKLKIENGELVADGRLRTALSSSLPGKGDAFTLNLKLLPRVTNAGTNTRLEITPTIEAGLPEISAQTFRVKGSGASLPLATELSMSAEARYYTEDGDQLGRGPLPPTVGEATKYWVFVQVQNGSNNVSGATFSTTLAPGVSFTGKQSVSIGSPLQFDPSSKSVTWSNDELPAHSETGLYFEVAVTPSPEQVGKTVLLTKDLDFYAVDNFVGKKFNLSAAPISNVLKTNDRGAKSGATVAAQ